MSEIRANTVSNAAGTGPVTLTGQYAAKVWANINGLNPSSIRDSFNISSLVDNGVGYNTLSYTSSMSDANYMCNVSAGNNLGNGEGSWVCTRDTSTTLTGSVVVVTFDNAGSYQDTKQVFYSTDGDLA